jgi:hypothetical protein
MKSRAYREQALSRFPFSLPDTGALDLPKKPNRLLQGLIDAFHNIPPNVHGTES